MDIQTFRSALERDGYSNIETRSSQPNVRNAPHAHDFEVRALVLEGEVTVRYEGRTQTCRAGDTLTMAAGCEHSEEYGPAGATYLFGRKTPAR